MNSNYVSIDFFNEIPLFDYNFSLINHEFEQWNQEYEAFNFKESKDKLIINILDGSKKGQFIFPKELLFKKGIISSEKHKGKMAIRVYPSWERDLNKTAVSTQKWQIPYFLDFTKGFDEEKIKELYLS